MTPSATAELDSALPGLLREFYEAVREDPDLGPVFEAVQDLPDHLVQLEAFWSSVMTASGRYKGNPMAAHLRHRASIRPEMWTRWLSIWTATTDERLSPSLAQAMQTKAARIAQSLSLALHYDATSDAPDPVVPRDGLVLRRVTPFARPGANEATSSPSPPPSDFTTALDRPRDGLANASSAHPAGRSSQSNDQSGDC